MRGWATLLFAGLLLAFPVGSPARVGATYTFAGTWDTNYGSMTLTAGGSGTYFFCDGTINGSVSGNKLTGTWTQKWPCGQALEGSGPVEFTLTEGGQRFSGRWRYASSNEGWRTDWYGLSCKFGPCLKNGEELGLKPNRSAVRRGVVTVAIAGSKYAAQQVDIASGATLKICNRDSAGREAHTLPKTGPNAFRVRLKPGACLTHKLVNSGKGPIKLLVFAVPLSQAKLTVFIHPAR